MTKAWDHHLAYPMLQTFALPTHLGQATQKAHADIIYISHVHHITQTSRCSMPSKCVTKLRSLEQRRQAHERLFHNYALQ